MARVYQGERTFLTRVVGPVERLIYRIVGVRADEEMDWKTYAVAMLLFNSGRLAVRSMLYSVSSLSCRSIPRIWQRSSLIWLSIRRSASPPIPTGRATAERPP